MADNFYKGKKKTILKSFDRQFRHAERYLSQSFDKSTIEKIHNDGIEEIRKLMPELPDVGGRKNLFIDVVLFCAWYIPFFKAVSRQGMSADEFVKMMTHVIQSDFTRYPRFIRHIGGKLVPTGFFMRYIRKHADASRKREHSDDWVYSVCTEKNDPGVAFKVKYSQCAVCVIMNKADAGELLPYCNFVDFIMAKSLGYGFENPGVLGRGDEMCVEIFRKDGKCKVPGYLEFAFKDLKF